MPSLTHPRQLVLVTSRAKINIMGKETDKDNITATTFHMPCSLNPTHYCISLHKNKFSTKLIKESKVFTVNFILNTLHKESDFCLKHSGEHIDKFEKTKLEKEEAEKIDCCRVKDALGFLECEVINELESGDHIIFIGKVINSELKQSGKRLFLEETDRYTTTMD